MNETTRMRLMLMRARHIATDAFDFSHGEMNPGIVREFVSLVLAKDLPHVLWEPCAGHTGRSKAQDSCASMGVKLVSFDLNPSDDRVQCADATIDKPGIPIGGMIFHPPYFDCIPFSDKKGEICNCEKADYISLLDRIVENGKSDLADGGLVCAVCRDYGSKHGYIKLSEWFLELFLSHGFILDTTWIAMPDVALIFKKV